MSPSATQPSRWSLEARLIRKALRDPDYRRDLLFRSREVIEREVGGALPDGVAVLVLNEKPGEILMVLPWAGHRQLGSLDLAEADGGPASFVGAWAQATLRAMADPGWRATLERDAGALIADPLLRVPGRRRPRRLRIRVQEEGPRTVQVVLPHPSRAHLRVATTAGRASPTTYRAFSPAPASAGAGLASAAGPSSSSKQTELMQ